MRPVLILSLLVLPVLVLAQVVPSPDDPNAFIEAIVAAVQGGDWRAVAILAVIGVVALARRFGGAWVPWLRTARGGALLALAGGIVSTLGPALFSGGITLSALLNGLINGVAAAGGWVVARRLIYGEAVPPNPAPGS
ncbi:MAG TPA: hypothetical protein VLS93_09705 [Anaeromyxobacteraceae bacterium]|nr:hypothetical protein [Anaeromyxobacteraceae bacterium]